LRAAENYLRSVETQAGFPVLLLQLIGSGADAAICQAGAVFFKNYVKRNWVQGEDTVRFITTLFFLQVDWTYSI
jgi:hypothetical protein